jgi:hypothetical protein
MMMMMVMMGVVKIGREGIKLQPVNVIMLLLLFVQGLFMLL